MVEPRTGVADCSVEMCGQGLQLTWSLAMQCCVVVGIMVVN